MYPLTLESFSSMGMLVGITMLAKRMVLAVNGVQSERRVYKSGKIPSRSPWRRMIYEIFMLTGSWLTVPDRRFNKDVIWKLKNGEDIKTVLAPDKNANRSDRIAKIQASDEFQLLSSISQVVDEILVPVDEEEVGEGEETAGDTLWAGTEAGVSERDLDRIEARIEMALDDDATRCPDESPNQPSEEPTGEATEKEDKETSKRLGYNRNMVRDIWIHGTDLLTKDNVQKQRIDAYARRQRKNLIYDATVANNDISSETAVDLRNDSVNEVPQWNQMMRDEFSDLF